jgi:NDP-sugar pyrophosphorylase family protein
LSKGRLRYQIMDGFWTDAGTLESLSVANQLVNSNKVSF